jgi:hypothetical protein
MSVIRSYPKERRLPYYPEKYCGARTNVIMKMWLITLLVCFVIYGIIEHLILPLFWMIRYRNRKSIYGPSGMIGKRFVVKAWNSTRGKVWVDSDFYDSRYQSQRGNRKAIHSLRGKACPR